MNKLSNVLPMLIEIILFLRFHKGDHVVIESRNDTHSRFVISFVIMANATLSVK